MNHRAPSGTLNWKCNPWKLLSAFHRAVSKLLLLLSRYLSPFEEIYKRMKKALDFVLSMEFWRMGLLWTFSLLISYWNLFFSQTSRSSPPSLESRPVCVITGATSGLGAAAAHALSRHGFFVVLVGRSSHSLEKTMMDVKSQNENAQLKAFEVDLSSLRSILQFKASLQQWLSDSQMHSSIQLLINNAGILATSSRFTSEGYDQMMATNYFSAFSLSKLFLPLLRNSPVPSRIVNVTSFTHRSVSNIQVDKETVSGKCFGKSKRYPYAHVYEYSKLFLLLFSYELHRQLGVMDISRQVSIMAVDPGVVKTNIMRDVPPCLSNLAFVVLRLFCLLQSPEVGVSSILDAALLHQKHLEFTSLVEREGLSALLCFHRWQTCEGTLEYIV